MKNNLTKPRVVIDTNILVSALVFGGNPRRITDMIAEKTIRPVMSEEIMTELRRIINVKFPQHIPLVELYEKLLRSYAIWVPLGANTIDVCRDPDDNAVIETAVNSDSNYIISGDKDLLVLEKYKDIKIVSSTDFLELIR